MKDQKEIRVAWQIWHLISRLNDLIWDHYEDEFVRLCQQGDEPDWENFTDTLRPDDSMS
ncbi:hypothetical protein ACFL0M_11150 [Thermodesulfobacteriota bacterium]